MNAAGDFTNLERTDLELLLATSHSLSAEIGIVELLDLILDAAGSLTESPDASLLLHDSESMALYFAAAMGDSAPELLEKFGRDSIQWVPLESVAGRVFASGEPLVSGDLGDASGHFRGTDEQTGHRSDSMVCVPMEVGGVRIGVMQVLNKRDGRTYTARDVEALKALAAQAGIAIRNARLVDDLMAHMGLGSVPAGRSPFKAIEEIDGPPHTEELSVMFADMRSFTQLSSLLPAEQLRDILNEFLTMLCDVVIRWRGTVNKLQGDGMLALFRDGDYAVRAAQCALAMCQTFDQLRVDWDRSSNVALGFVDIGIGIATDRVMLATLGNRQVRDFTPFGRAVNLAHAFEYAARNGHRIFMDQRTNDALGPGFRSVGPETFHLTKPGQDVSHPYKRYELLVEAPVASGPCFLSHNSADKEMIRQIARALERRGVSVWLDEDQLTPGLPWQERLEQAIERAGSTAILVGSAGIGRWEEPEARVALSAHHERGMPVIPVLIPGGPEMTDLPAFLREFTAVDLRSGLTDEGLDRLEWGIRGTRS